MVKGNVRDSAVVNKVVEGVDVVFHEAALVDARAEKRESGNDRAHRLNVFIAADWVRLLTGVTIFLALYLVTAPPIDAINQTDVNNLRPMFPGLGITSKLLEIPLKLVETPLKNAIHKQRKSSNRAPDTFTFN